MYSSTARPNHATLVREGFGDQLLSIHCPESFKEDNLTLVLLRTMHTCAPLRIQEPPAMTEPDQLHTQSLVRPF